MTRDYNSGRDISSDIESDSADNERADFGGELTREEGVDLNVPERQGMAKAAIMSCEATLPEDYNTSILPSDYAEYQDVPGPKTPEQVAAEMSDAWDYAGPANESEATEDPPKPEYADSPPEPPQDDED